MDGKTCSESLANPEVLHNTEREIAEFRRFQRLIREFVEVNTRMCRLRARGSSRRGARGL
jgi:hypothetical protein